MTMKYPIYAMLPLDLHHRVENEQDWKRVDRLFAIQAFILIGGYLSLVIVSIIYCVFIIG